MKVKRMFYSVYVLFVFCIVGALAVLSAGDAQAWGHYTGAFRTYYATVDSNAPGTHAYGMSPAQVQQGGQNQGWTSESYAYVRYFTGFDINHNPQPWAGNGENLNKAIVYWKGKIDADTPHNTDQLKVEVYHISDDTWLPQEITWATQPLWNDMNFFPGFGTQVIATLLDTQTVGLNYQKITWDLLANPAYLDIWNNQDKLDHNISLMFKISGTTDRGKTIFQQDSYSISLEGLNSPNDNVYQPVPVPAAIWLLGSGLAGLIAARRKTRR